MLVAPAISDCGRSPGSPHNTRVGTPLVGTRSFVLSIWTYRATLDAY